MDAADWDARYAGTELIWTDQPTQFLVEHTSDVRAGKALDVACGEGRNAVWLASRGFAVTAIDFSSIAIGKAKLLADAKNVNVDWRVGDVTESLPDDRFDLVTVLYLHLPADRFTRLIADLLTRLSPGGTLLVVGHHVDNLTDGHGGPQDAAILHDHRTIAGQLTANGSMAVVTAARVERAVTVDDEHRYALDSLVRATCVGLG